MRSPTRRRLPIKIIIASKPSLYSGYGTATIQTTFLFLNLFLVLNQGVLIDHTIKLRVSQKCRIISFSLQEIRLYI
jgi:hypothetical protein